MTLEQNVAEAHFKAGRLMEAQAAFWALVRANPRQPKAWERLGDIALKLGQPGQAYDFYGNAYDFNPDAPGVRLGLGRALCKMGRLQEATAHLKKARAHLELAEILEKLERDEEAVLAYRNHLAQDEHDADAMLRLASVLVRLKNYEEADELLHLATLLQSENPAPLFMQGDIKQRSHELAAAENYYRQALRVDPTYAPA
ncbi:MAG: tetratricopeptide repeat protein, partial [Rhodospirillales bacterium]